MKTISLFFCVTFLMSGLLFQSCAPVFSELQSARLAGKKRIELTPSYSTVSSSSDGETDGLQNELGLHAAYGVTPKMDFRVRYQYAWAKGDDFNNGISMIGFGPKISLLENKIALSLLAGTAFGEDITDAWEFQPSMLFTLPAVENKIDITLAPKYIFTFCEDCDDFVAVNLGLAISSDLSSWAIRPEYGRLYDFGEAGHVGQFSIGFSKTFGK
ncbi:MAG: hypothetical protein IPP15_00815 [Saprospiraceae bacterium]|uniref:Outer membrane protein beta-barrel domain-containing protein n=1 Tax=Candidatus Opimibacter skivensis TaxID=2982028 RepID=A0A9D7SSI3_9BACT|nr:hypothetical protein [Candidatus Opimibacter skivensis]